MRAVRRVNTKTLKRAAQSHTGPLGVSRILRGSSTHCLLLKATSYLAAFQTGTLSAATIHFKDTWKSTHIRLWPYITANLFDVTLPCMAMTSTHKHTQASEGKKNHIFFFSAVANGRLLPGKEANTEQQQQNTSNKSWFADTALICLTCWPCLSLMKRSDRKHMLEKSREVFLNYRCRPAAIHQN